jgi:hypothetical protein
MGRHAHMNKLVNKNPCPTLRTSVPSSPGSLGKRLTSPQLFKNALRSLRSDESHSDIPARSCLLGSVCPSVPSARCCRLQTRPRRCRRAEGGSTGNFSRTDARRPACRDLRAKSSLPTRAVPEFRPTWARVCRDQAAGCADHRSGPLTPIPRAVRHSARPNKTGSGNRSAFKARSTSALPPKTTSPPLYERQLSRSSMGQQHDEAEPEDFSLSIRDPALRQQRKQAAKAVVMASILMTVAVWACLSIFWGSTCA